MKLTKALSLFKKTAEPAPKTVVTYRSALRSLEEFGIADTKDLTRAKLAEWVLWRQKQDVTHGSINTQLGGILSVASHLERIGRFPLFRLRSIRRLRVKVRNRPDPAFLEPADFAKLLVHCRAVDFKLELAVMFAALGGMRLNELMRLHREDLMIDGDHQDMPFLKVSLERGPIKNHRSRTTPLRKEFAAWLRKLELQPGPLFPPESKNNPGRYMSLGTIKRHLVRARSSAGLPRVNWLMLRHCFASWIRQDRGSLDLAAAWMGNTKAVCDRNYASAGAGGNPAIQDAFGRVLRELGKAELMPPPAQEEPRRAAGGAA